MPHEITEITIQKIDHNFFYSMYFDYLARQYLYVVYCYNLFPPNSLNIL